MDQVPTGKEQLPGWRGRRFWLGLTVALAGALTGFVLTTIANRLVVIGPFDRTTFGWIFVAPIWVGAPIVAGFIWSDMATRAKLAAAALLWMAVGIMAALVFWLGVALIDCGPYGSRTSPAGWIMPSLILGVLIGSGPGLSAIAAMLPRKSRVAFRLVLPLFLQAIWFVAVGLAFSLIVRSSAGCNPPF